MNPKTDHSVAEGVKPSAAVADGGAAPADNRPLLLLVDDEPANLAVLREILKKDYRLIFARDGRSAVKMAFEQEPALVLLDVMMPDYSGFDVCRLLGQRKETRNTPVIFVTALSDTESEFRGFHAGAVDYVCKPINALSLKSRVAANLRLVRAEQLAAANTELRAAHQRLKESFEGTVNVLSEVLEHLGTRPAGFGERCAKTARRMALRMGLSEADQQDVYHAALLSRICDVLQESMEADNDAGLISEAARHKLALEKSTLTTEGLLMPIDGFQNASNLIKNHHERFDGKGFPRGLGARHIPKGSFILDAAKWFHELIETSLHGPLLGKRAALDTMRPEAGYRFSSEVFRALEETVLENEAEAPVEFVLRDVRSLRPGMALAQDLRHPKGMLLLAAGRPLTSERIANIIDYCQREKLRLSLAIDPASLPR